MSGRPTAGDTGVRGERIAEAYLVQKGYAVLARNYRYGHKEIDLVLRDGETVVFTEVKARADASFGTPGAYVDRHKRQNLTVAAEAYLAQNGLTDSPARFDVVEIYLKEKRIRHIPDAFGRSLP